MTNLLFLIGLVLLFFIFRKKNAFLWVPLVYLLLQFIYPYITDINSDVNFQINTASSTLRNMETVLILVLCIAIFLRSKGKKKYYGSNLVLIFGFFLLFLTATDFWFSLKAYVRFASVLLILPASYLFFKNSNQDILFYKIVFYTNVIAVLYIIYSSVFELGFPYYREPILYYGGLRLFGLYMFIYSFPLLIIMLTLKIYRREIIILLISTMVLLILISMKRSVILITIFQFGLYYLFFTFRRRYLSSVIAISIVLFGLIYTFQDSITEMMSVRETRLRTSIYQEGRYLEYLIIYDEQIKPGEFRLLLLGKDIFNHKGNFGEESSVDLKTEERYLHSDYAMIIFSLGMLGFILYMRIFYLIFRDFRRYRKVAWKTKGENQAYGFAFITVLFSLVINGAIDGYYIFFSRSFSFIVIGFLLAQYYKNYHATLARNNYVKYIVQRL